MLLDLKNINKSFGIDIILKDINLTLNEGDRIGILGENGAGKTTLLNIITKKIEYDNGNLYIQNGIEIGYLKQNNALDSSKTIIEEVKSVFNDIYAVEKRLEEMRKAGKIDREYDKLNTAFEGKDGYNLDVKINMVLNGMGFKDYDKTTCVSKLSGGEKNRLAFAKLLLKNPEILILDEPTNHLDFEALSWLEGYLRKYKGAILVVSHDRYFLDNIVSDICEIEDTYLTRYKGNYSQFINQKEAKIELAEKEYEKQQEEIAKLKDFVEKNLAKSASVNGVGTRVKALEKMEILTKPKPQRKKITLKFSYDVEPYKNVFHGEKISVNVGENNKELVKEISFDIERGEKIAIVGLNGVGKTSFIKAIMGKIPCTGRMKWSDNIKISYFAQENEQLNSQKTVLEEVHDRFPGKYEVDIRSILGGLLITGEDVYKKIEKLSGGERAKVVFAIMMLERANVMVLDEPTNHLDYASKEILEKALQEYKGTIIVISHDRYLLNKVPDKIIEMQFNNMINYQGNYDYYKEHRQSINEVKPALKEKTETLSQYYRSKEQRAIEQKEKNRKKKLEIEMQELETEIDELQHLMEKPEIVSDYIKLNEICIKMEEKKKMLDTALEEWIK